MLVTKVQLQLHKHKRYDHEYLYKQTAIPETQYIYTLFIFWIICMV